MVKSLAFITSIAGIAMFLPGCKLLGPSDGEPLGLISFETIKQSGYLAVAEPTAVVFRDQAKWNAFWDAHIRVHRDGRPLPPPEFDFRHNVLVGLFWESQSGCDSDVEAVESIEGTVDEVQIHLRPVPFLGPCLAIVYPQQIITFERTRRPIVLAGNVPG